MISFTGDHGLQPSSSLQSQHFVPLLAAIALILPCQLSAPAQDAAPADRNAINSRVQPGGMLADSPVQFPAQGALPARFPSDLKVEQFDPAEPDYFLFSSPERSLAQVRQIQAALPPGRFTPPPNDWEYLANTRRILTEGGSLHIMAIGDSIVNDTMRSGWASLLQAAYPKAAITATVYVRGGGGAQHFRENDRLARQVFPRRPDLVYLGGISQRSIADLAAVIEELRVGLPKVEILLGTGAFGTTDPRDPAALGRAPHSGTGDYGRRLRQLADEQRCAFLDFTTPWAEYLNSSGLHPHRFYRDVVHANEFGEQVLANIFISFWQPELERAVAPVQSLEWFAESRSEPRALQIHGLRLDLRDVRHALDVLVARDPDDAGPAEAELTSPARLLQQHMDIVAAINANAFAHSAPLPEGRIGTWRAGDPVNISGWAMHPSREASRPTANESLWGFWLTMDGRARVSPLEPQGAARLAIAGFAPLLLDGRVTAEAGGPLHPRTAIGVDMTGHRVVMVVVDGRQPGYSEGMSLAELAELMRSLGCHDALNLDGGGSSILFRRREDGSLAIMNRPASIPARPIPVMLVVRSTGLIGE
jgi:hypothetical protein